MTWGIGKWGEFLWGEASLVNSVSPTVMPSIGGEIMVLTGAFAIDSVVKVHLGPLGTTADPLCYGGQGLADEALSLDGVTVRVAIPPLEKGSVVATVIQGSQQQTIGGITIVERSWPGKLHRIRRSFPPWMEAGKRLLNPEELA